MRWLAYFGALAALVMAAPAQAATTISADSDASRPYQRWVDRSLMPTPDDEIRVTRGPCPSNEVNDYTNACTQNGASEIWLMRLGGVTKRRFFHEIGHNFDYVELDDAERAALAARMRTSGPWRQPEANSFSPHEVFAETYKQCVLGTKEESPVPVIGTERRLRRVCRLIEESY